MHGSLPLFLGGKKKRQKKNRIAAELVRLNLLEERKILYPQPASNSSGGVLESGSLLAKKGDSE